MHKILVFDLDGTLAGLGKGIQETDLFMLKKLEQMGYQIAICSGKPTYYLCGFMRQVELKNPILIGENGGNIQFGVDLPPERFYLYPYSETAREQIKTMRAVIEERFYQDVWFQPNVVGLTPFPKEEKIFDEIAHLLETKKDYLTDVLVYRHVDSFDITPKEINKYNGLQFLGELAGIGREDMIAIGDGVNDVPMLEYADYAIGIGEKMKEYTDVCFDDITSALTYIVEHKI